ncbi:MAG: YjgP/YjgQ family permease [Bacteroides sp.]|nr:YjgP/YjgQ family permease [Bacteroides sp.]
MRIIKRLYGFILKSFLPLFAMTFFIVLFIVLMQFLWKYIDDLVGKGLSMSLIAELFFYAAVSMIPMALPLAILLASLMTFGNFGEKFELTAMKASGISLLHAMRPLIILIAFISVGAFFFQNYVLPPAQVKMWTLLFSMRQKSPELEIPEGVFYDQIPGYNLFVERKNRDTGMLHGLMIYDVSHGGDNSTILLADSGQLAFTGDMRYLYLHLYEGEQFENLREQKSLDRNVPFRREAFSDKEVLIPFDANFNRLDEGGMRNQYVGKDIKELRHTIDSIGTRLDSTGRIYANDLKRNEFPIVHARKHNVPANAIGDTSDKSISVDSLAAATPINLDSLLSTLNQTQRAQVFSSALDMSKRKVADYQFKSLMVHEDKRVMRRHEIELIKKYTLSVACLIFFFIGAPLGAIIRKGGLGTPLVISVLLFLFYYIIDNTGYKMARDGRWPVWLGIWLSTFILAPLGIYVTVKAMNDSAVFDSDRYKAFFRKILGLKQERSVTYKEVIINDISVADAISRLSELKEEAHAFFEKYNGKMSYRTYWIEGLDLNRLSEIIESLEENVVYMTDCRNAIAVNKLMDYPVVRKLWIYRPGVPRWVGTVGIWLFPVGFPIYLIGLKAKKKLMEEMQKIESVSDTIINILENPQPTKE